MRPGFPYFGAFPASLDQPRPRYGYFPPLVYYSYTQGTAAVIRLA